MALTLKRLSELVDELGMLKAQADVLAEREKEIKDALVKAGRDKIDGALFAATVSQFDRTTLDSKLVKQYLSAKAYAACQKTTPVVAVKVTARSAAQTLRGVA